MLQVAELCEKLGRCWESWAWYHLALTVNPNDETAKKGTERLRVLTSSDPPLVVKDNLPATLIDLSYFPLPTWQASDVQQVAVARAIEAHPQFENVAAAAQLDFVYNNGDDPTVPGMMICHELGGAIAVIDFDLDHWPDIYIAQGGPWPLDPNQTEYRDRLFRNLGDGKFVDVTEPAGLGDTGYSQGTTIGDYDSDGWPDIFVANLGANRLFHNQGDGTFIDVTDQAGIAGERWSTSVAMADLNGDGLADIYEVNYLTGKEPLETVCVDEGQERACPPSNFAAEQDHLYVNQGDGRFVDATQESGIVLPYGVGLGIIVCDFHENGKPSVYVSNDMTANFFFVNQAAQRGDPLQYLESALPAGLAYDRDGLAQASMGITVGDGDDDGLIDLFLTHFFAESNTFYKQMSLELFEDVTQSMGLREPSLPVLTFGTQFIDFENDGRLDLVCACGHVDDYRHNGKPYMMKPQVYANLGGGKFALIPQESVGDYFTGEYLGRSLALIDWDRDGRQDFCVLHLYVPVALLANRTTDSGHYLKLYLKGIESERDAITTTVHARIGDRTIVRQLTAGDGFQCSSQRVIHLGVGDATQIDELLIRWPAGLQQKFENVPVDREVLLLEGAGQLMDLPRD